MELSLALHQINKCDQKIKWGFRYDRLFPYFYNKLTNTYPDTRVYLKQLESRDIHILCMNIINTIKGMEKNQDDLLAFINKQGLHNKYELDLNFYLGVIDLFVEVLAELIPHFEDIEGESWKYTLEILAKEIINGK